MGNAQFQTVESDPTVYLVSGRRNGDTTSPIRIALAALVVVACVWMHFQNAALGQRVDADTAAWASQSM